MKKGLLIVCGLIMSIILANSLYVEYLASKCQQACYIQQYLTVPFYNFLTIMVAIFISFFLTQKKTDERKLKDAAQNIIEKLIDILSDDRLYTINTQDDLDFVRITQKRISNHLNVLNKYSEKNGLEEKMSYIKMQFDGYWNLISNHINDVDHLKNSQKDLLNHITNIEGRLTEVMFELHM